MHYIDMSTLFKLANKVESSLRKYAFEHILKQLNDLVSAAYHTFQMKSEVKNLIGSDDVYGEYTTNSIHKLMEGLYFGASALKEQVLKKGIQKQDMASRLERLVSLSNQALQLLDSTGVDPNTVTRLGFNIVKAKAEDMVPVSLPAFQKAPAAPVSSPAETGNAFLATEKGHSEEDLQKGIDRVRQDYGQKTDLDTEVPWKDYGKEEPSEEELQKALDVMTKEHGQKTDFDSVVPWKNL